MTGTFKEICSEMDFGDQEPALAISCETALRFKQA